MSLDFLRPDPAELASFFLAAKYVYVLLFGVVVFLVYRWKRPWLLVVGTIGLCVYAWMAGETPLKRLYAFAPPYDRMFNVAMTATSATGHSPFESYQVATADLEPFWRLAMRVAARGRPENVLDLYPYLPGLVLVLLPLSLYFALGRSKRDESDAVMERRWEVALIVYAVMLLNSSSHEQFGVFRSFWAMNFLLKPNHVLGFVLIPLWVWAWTSPLRWCRTFGAGVILAALAWVFLMHWSYVLVGLAAYPLVARWAGRPPELGRTSLVAGISFLAAVPYVVFLVSNFHWGYGGAVAQKIWLQFGYEEGFFNVFSVGYEHGLLFFLSLAGIAGMAARRGKEDVLWLALLLGTVVGWAGYVLLIGFQKIIEPDEFYFYSRFLLSVAAGSGAYFTIKAAEGLVRGSLNNGHNGNVSTNPRLVSLFLLLTLPLSVPYWWNPPEMDRYYHLALEPIPTERSVLGEWIRENTSPDDVFVAGSETSLWIAALSGRRVLLTGHHRPSYDYEDRKDLERRLLADREPAAYREAWDRFQVTHLALDSEFVSALEIDSEQLESLPWLELVFEGEAVKILAIRQAKLGITSSFPPEVTGKP